MEIVIKIPEEIMEYIKNNDCLSVFYIDEVAKAIGNGTPLSKGHGRLIDASYKVSSDGRTIDAVCGYIAPTIIEADNAESEDKE